MVQDGDHPVRNRVGLRGVPHHLHTQLPVVQPVLPGGDAGRDRQPAGHRDRVDDGQRQHQRQIGGGGDGCESDDGRWRAAAQRDTVLRERQ